MVGFKEVEEYLTGIVRFFEHAGRYFVGELVAVSLAVDVKVRYADRCAIGISVGGTRNPIARG